MTHPISTCANGTFVVTLSSILFWGCSSTPETQETPPTQSNQETSAAPADEKSPPSSVDSAVSSPTGEEVVQGETVYYEGTMTVIIPDGRTVGKNRVLLMRNHQPSAQKILEHVVTVDGRPDHPPQEFMVEITINGQAFQMNERKGAFSGEGEFTAGEPGKWTAWKSKSTMPDGSTVSSEDALTENGLVANKILTTPDGKEIFRFKEELNVITKEAFQKERAAAFSQ